MKETLPDEKTPPPNPRPEDLHALIDWARRGIADAAQDADPSSIAAAERAADYLTTGHDPTARIGRIELTAHCAECDADADPTTRRHLDADAEDCPYEHDDIPDNRLRHALRCPACGGYEIAEVNVGEIWDEVYETTFDGRTITLRIDQLACMDRVGDGWICQNCLERLELPAGHDIEYDYN